MLTLQSSGLTRPAYRFALPQKYRKVKVVSLKEIEPFLDGRQVEYVGEVNDNNKSDFLGRAKALLFPIDWPEPFGLVMIEAMACGTPVIALPCGSVPEIVSDSKTGFIVRNDVDAIDAINRIQEINRRQVRAEFEHRFSARRMAREYLGCYSDLIARTKTEELGPKANSHRLRDVYGEAISQA